jgi:hypothetical protein
MLHTVKGIWAKALLSVLRCLNIGRKCYTMYLVCSEKFGFGDTHHHWIAKGNLLWNHGRPIVTRTRCEKDDRLETDARSASNCTNAIDHEVYWGSSVGVVPNLEQYSTSFSTAIFPQAQLWQLQYSTWTACIHKGRRRYTSSIAERNINAYEASTRKM